jgi:hypothetical protein
MPRVPAVCDNCGSIFAAPVELRDGGGIHFTNVLVGPCPQCGGDGRIPDGMYSALGNTIRVLLTSERSVSDLQAVLTRIKAAQSPEQAEEIIKIDAPELQNLLPLYSDKGHKRIATLASLLMIIIGVMQYLATRQGVTEMQLNDALDRFLNRATAASTPTPSPEPRNRHERRAAKRHK